RACSSTGVAAPRRCARPQAPSATPALRRGWRRRRPRRRRGSPRSPPPARSPPPTMHRTGEASRTASSMRTEAAKAATSGARIGPPPPIAIRPELRHLRAFLAVAEQGSANRAGAALYRAQSAVSRSIRKLEDELGVELFERRARGMLLTQYGRALLVRARRVHAEMQAARNDSAALAEKGRIGNAPIFGMLTHERRVRAFVALAEQHHMPSVAESLGITQPAVSIAIRQIEDSIGIALFRRTARGTVPTPAGAALTLRLKRALAEIRHAVGEIASL